MLVDFWHWIGQLSNSKVVALLIFFPLFIGIVLYVYSNKERSRRFESYKYMPFQDDDEPEVKHEKGNVK